MQRREFLGTVAGAALLGATVAPPAAQDAPGGPEEFQLEFGDVTLRVTPDDRVFAVVENTAVLFFDEGPPRLVEIPRTGIVVEFADEGVVLDGGVVLFDEPTRWSAHHATFQDHVAGFERDVVFQFRRLDDVTLDVRLVRVQSTPLFSDG